MKSKKKIVIPVVILVILGIAAAIAIPRVLEAANKETPELEAPVNISVDTPGVGGIYPADTTDRNHRAGRNCVYHAKDERRNHCHQF